MAPGGCSPVPSKASDSMIAPHLSLQNDDAFFFLLIFCSPIFEGVIKRVECSIFMSRWA